MKADAGWSDERIAGALDVSIPTIERVRRRFVFEGLEAALRLRRPKRASRVGTSGRRRFCSRQLICASL